MLQETYDLIAKVEELVNTIKNDLLPLSVMTDNLELKEQCLLHIYLDTLSEQLDEGKKACDKMRDLAAVNINHSMTKQEIDKVTIHGFNWYPKTEAHFNCKVENQAAFHAWCKANAPEIIKETVHPQTLKAYCNGLIEAGKETPPMLSKFEKETVMRRKDK